MKHCPPLPDPVAVPAGDAAELERERELAQAEAASAQPPPDEPEQAQEEEEEEEELEEFIDLEAVRGTVDLICAFGEASGGREVDEKTRKRCAALMLPAAKKYGGKLPFQEEIMFGAGCFILYRAMSPPPDTTNPHVPANAKAGGGPPPPARAAAARPTAEPTPTETSAEDVW